MKQANQEARDDLQRSPGASSVSARNAAAGISHDPYRALRLGGFRLLLGSVFIAAMGEQMIAVAIGWELYDRTHSALVLGIVGLVQVFPVVLFSLPAGHLADRFNRKRIVIYSQALLALSSLGLAILSIIHGELLLIYGCLMLGGIAAAFGDPASSALFAQVVPQELFENASTWQSSTWQLSSVLGPALGGFLIALFRSAAPVYALFAGASLVALVLLLLIHERPQEVHTSEQTTLRALLEGLRFLRSTQVLLAAITLDLFAVLLGGATTLLPIYARDILRVGPTGLGWLQAAPSIGAICVAVVIAHRPPFRKAGRTLLLAVCGFGAATIIFGLSRSFWLSLLMLFLLGGLDNISVVIRSTLLLTRTPDAMRGRISAVNSLFIACSNRLGGFESGVAAQMFGPLAAVVGGGVGTILVVLCVALLWPEMRRLGALNEGLEGNNNASS